MQNDTPKGQCARCGDFNPYTAMICSGCSSRLPWADAVSGRARTNASTGASSTGTNARATVNPSSPTGQGSTSSANSRQWFGSAGAIALLVVGIMIGAGLAMPSLVAFPKPTPQKDVLPRPTPTTAVNNSSDSTPNAAQPSPTQSQPIESQPSVATPDETLATPEEDKFSAAVERAFDYIKKGDNANLKDATVRANMRADLDQAMVELSSEPMSERFARAGMVGVMSLTREAIMERRICLSMTDGALDEKGEVQDVPTLDEAIKHAEKSRDLFHSAAQRMREINDKLSR